VPGLLVIGGAFGPGRAQAQWMRSTHFAPRFQPPGMCVYVCVCVCVCVCECECVCVCVCERSALAGFDVISYISDSACISVDQLWPRCISTNSVVVPMCGWPEP